MSNIVNGLQDENLGSGKVVKVKFVTREGEELGEFDLTEQSIKEARDIPGGNRVPYLNRSDWHLAEISPDGTTWTIDVVH